MEPLVVSISLSDNFLQNYRWKICSVPDSLPGDIMMNGISNSHLSGDRNGISLLKIAERVGQTICSDSINLNYDIEEEIGR